MKLNSNPFMQMRSKAHFKFLLFGFIVAFLLLILRSTVSSTNQNPFSNLRAQTSVDPLDPNIDKEATLTSCPQTCNKILPSLAQALIHYSTSNITPQQTFKEISISSAVLEKRSPCNFLVFGLGHDSLMWSALNHGGLTVFLEEDKSWIEQIKLKLPSLNAYHVVYDTKVHQAEKLMKIGMGADCTIVSDPRSSKCQLALKGLPKEIYEKEWDLIMVDAPTGFYDGAPGRMSVIYTAGLMAKNRKNGETDVFVHDVDRVVEDRFSKAFLCEGYLKQQEGRLRHFTIPGHKSTMNRPFCPSIDI